MATAKKLPSGAWRVLVYAGKDAEGKRQYKSFTAMDKREAEFAAAEWLPAFVAADRLPVFVAADRLPVFVAADRSPVSDFPVVTRLSMYFTLAFTIPGIPISAPIVSLFATRLLSSSVWSDTSSASTSQYRLSDGG